MIAPTSPTEQLDKLKFNMQSAEKGVAGRQRPFGMNLYHSFANAQTVSAQRRAAMASKVG